MEKRVPLRKCLGCMSSFPKKDLVRVLKTPEGEVILDLSGKKSGRGAYICPKFSCFEKAYKSKRLERCLEVEIPEGVYETAKQQIEAGEANE